ncbi:MAG TPA: hypothetical protein VHE61_15375 [Opitutaceae bacterium]|nr:hypothetical protein [Opitutaceae bacterium]
MNPIHPGNRRQSPLRLAPALLPVCLAFLAATEVPAQTATPVVYVPSSDLSSAPGSGSPPSTPGTLNCAGSPTSTTFYPYLADMDHDETGNGVTGTVVETTSTSATCYYACAYANAPAATVSQVVVSYYVSKQGTNAATVQLMLYKSGAWLATASSHAVTATSPDSQLCTDTFTFASNYPWASNLQTMFVLADTGSDSTSSIHLNYVRIACTMRIVTPPALSFVINNVYLAGIRAVPYPTGVTSGTVTGEFLAEHFFKNSSTSVIYTNSPQTAPVPTGWSPIPAENFPAYGSTITGYSGFQPTQSNNQIDGSIKMVIYDNESWNQTPLAEQQDPQTYMADFASLAHTHGYQMMAATGVDIVLGNLAYNNPSHPGQNTTYDYYFSWIGIPGVSNSGIPGLAAYCGSDDFAVQMQSHQVYDGSDYGIYSDGVNQAITEALAQNSAEKIIPVLSPSLGNVSDMEAAVLATYKLPNVSAYWLNAGSQYGYQAVTDLLYQLYLLGF